MIKKVGVEPDAPAQTHESSSTEALTNLSQTPILSSRAVPKNAESPAVHEHIARRLKDVYNDVLNQPVPDRFLGLLKDLEASNKK